MKDKLKKLFTLKGYFQCGLIANICFVIFILITVIYYSVFVQTQKAFLLIDSIAYLFEAFGFIFLAGSTLGLIAVMRDRKLMKTAISIYFFMELILVILDLNIIGMDFFDATNKAVIIIHCILSVGVCCTYLSLEPKKRCIEIVVTIASVIMSTGIFCVIYDARVYVSILINCFAYIILDTAIFKMLELEYIEVDCYGDTVSVLEVDSSTFFSDDKES